jgi:hypothetical protein
MSLHDFYTGRIQVFRDAAGLLQKKEKHLSYLRLIIFVGSLAGFYLLFSVSVLFAAVFLLSGLFVLGWVIKYQNSIIRQKEFHLYLTTINELELKSLSGDYRSFPDGQGYIDRDHPYSYDLDIFGRSSLFQYLNRTTSNPGADKLAEWLREPSGIEEIQHRQKAVLELKNLIDWRQQLMAIGYQYKEAADTPRELLEWLSSRNEFLGRKSLRILCVVASIISIGMAILVFMGYPKALLLLCLMFNFYIYYRNIKKINDLHKRVSKSYELIQSYSEAIRLIEKQKFTSSKLQDLQAVFIGDNQASEQVRKLSVLVNRLDTRLNVMISVPLNVFFFWDIHYCFGLEKWKLENSITMPQWFSVMAEMEALSSLSNAGFNNPGWVFPRITNDYFKFNAEKMGHPLIPAERRISNDFIIFQSGKIVLVTGSNMSGKSTFQRTCGVNMVLAFAGSAVCANDFEASIVKIITSMRISDSLEDNTSSFYAELKRLAMIIHESERNRNVFLLLDEILRGTNSNDRHIGSVALIKQLISQDTSAMLATHDLSLSGLAEEMPEKIDIYNFDVKIKGEELYFDYKLNPGVCKSLNASLLMKKMGIKV